MLKRERETKNHQSTKWSPICESWSQVEEKRIKNREYREIRAGHARHSIIVDLDHWNDEPGTNQVTRDACKRCSLGRFGRRLIPSGRTVCDGAPWIEIFAGRSVPVGDSGSKRADRRISCPRNRKRSAHTHTHREREREKVPIFGFTRVIDITEGKSVAHLRDVPSILERHRGGHWRNAYPTSS